MNGPWGKRNEDGRWHPLVDHCTDVAMVFRALLESTTVARITGLSKVQLDRLAVVAFLHDVGKCNWGFQAKGLAGSVDTAGHVIEAMTLLFELEDSWPSAWSALIESLCGWFGDEASSSEVGLAMLLAAISHHGRPVSEQDYKDAAGWDFVRYWRPSDGYNPLAAVDELARAARGLFPEAFNSCAPRIEATPDFQQRFAGLVMLADWVGSDTQFFPYRASESEDRPALARAQSARALKAIGLRPPASRAAHPFTHIFGFSPSPLQSLLAEGLDSAESCRLLLVESDTGSGKTEASLAWWLKLYARGKVDGLYFALPTRVSAKELYERVRRCVNRAFDEPTRPGPVLLAAPGYVQVDGERFPGTSPLPDPRGVLWDDRPEDAKRERLWSAERPKRFLAAPVAVGTIDQALLSVLRVKHSLLRSVCLDRHLLVVDEVHASDPYMREVLKALLRGHVARGGWALLLSATLGESAAAEFFGRQIASKSQAIQREYPAVTDYSGVHPVGHPAEARKVHVELSTCLDDDQSLVGDLALALKAGARVLVVCNTVARANALFRHLEVGLEREAPELLPSLFDISGVRAPHHGRFARADREAMDAQVSHLLGKGSPAGSRLLIGTQTLEQSLDIDADWLVCDLAPMDVLLQRIGRLHRHQREWRPAGFESPQVRVRIPARELASYVDLHGVLKGPAGLGRVYADGRVLQCTLSLLASRSTLVLPNDARTLIEGTTHTEAFADLPAPWPIHGRHIEGSVRAEVLTALRSVLDDKPFGELHYPDKSERIATRLGATGLDIPLAEPRRSAFGVRIDRVVVPAHLGPADMSAPEAVDAEPTPDGFRFLLGAQALRYTRFGLEKDDA